MSIASTQGPVRYAITTLPQTLAVTFPFALPTDLFVTDGAVILTMGSDYTVAGGGYNSLNEMQTGSITVVAAGAGNVQVGDTVTISRGIAPTQTTSFASTGIQTPLMIEADDDKLTCLIQQLGQGNFKPFAPVYGAPIMSFLGWITADTGGTKTSIDSLNVSSIPNNQVPLAIAVSIADDFEIWKLRPMQGGDPVASALPGFIVPVTNPLNLIWVRML